MEVYPNFTLFERNLSAIRQHRDALAHFGRYPQRNARLGRQNTPEEQAWLDDVENLPIWAGGKGGPFGKVIFSGVSRRTRQAGLFALAKERGEHCSRHRLAKSKQNIKVRDQNMRMCCMRKGQAPEIKSKSALSSIGHAHWASNGGFGRYSGHR